MAISVPRAAAGIAKACMRSPATTTGATRWKYEKMLRSAGAATMPHLAWSVRRIGSVSDPPGLAPGGDVVAVDLVVVPAVEVHDPVRRLARHDAVIRDGRGRHLEIGVRSVHLLEDVGGGPRLLCGGELLVPRVHVLVGDTV